MTEQFNQPATARSDTEFSVGDRYTQARIVMQQQIAALLCKGWLIKECACDCGGTHAWYPPKQDLPFGCVCCRTLDAFKQERKGGEGAGFLARFFGSY